MENGNFSCCPVHLGHATHRERRRIQITNCRINNPCRRSISCWISERWCRMRTNPVRRQWIVVFFRPHHRDGAWRPKVELKLTALVSALNGPPSRSKGRGIINSSMLDFLWSGIGVIIQFEAVVSNQTDWVQPCCEAKKNWQNRSNRTWLPHIVSYVYTFNCQSILSFA